MSQIVLMQEQTITNQTLKVNLNAFITGIFTLTVANKILKRKQITNHEILNNELQITLCIVNSQLSILNYIHNTISVCPKL